jgi:hypothetical protein
VSDWVVVEKNPATGEIIDYMDSFKTLNMAKRYLNREVEEGENPFWLDIFCDEDDNVVRESARDNRGKPLSIGDRVEFMGCAYTIKLFVAGKGSHGTCGIYFKEPQHNDRLADEMGVYKIEDVKRVERKRIKKSS